jgi:hypothetical protein
MGLIARRREAKEIERRVRFKQGKSKIEGYIKKLKASESKLLELGKRAHRLSDKEQFSHIAQAILWTQEQKNRWDRYLLQMETMEARRDQVQATGSFVSSMTALTKSMLVGVSPAKLAEIQMDMERALAKADSLEEVMAVMMDATAESVFGSEEATEEKIAELGKLMSEEAAQDESEGFDGRIADGLKAIEGEMKKG